MADTIKGKIENAGKAAKDTAKKTGENIQEEAEMAAKKTADAAKERARNNFLVSIWHTQ